MAYIGLKQLDPVLTGSLQVSGSSGVTGSLDVSSTGSFGKVIATTLSGDGSDLTNVFEGTTPSASISTRLTTEEANVDTLQSTMTSEQTNIDNLQTDSGSFSTRTTTLETTSSALSGTGTVQGVGTTNNVQFNHITASGAISASGNIRSKRFEIKGADNYIDRAYDGSLFLVSAADVAVQPGGGELTVDGNVVPNSDSADDLGSTSKYWRNAYIDSVITTGNVSGSVSSTGSFGKVEATSFSGDGSGLANVFEGTTPSSSISTRVTDLELDPGGIFVATGSIYSTRANLQVSGSLLVSGSTLTVRTGTDSGSPTASTAIFTNNITNGYPTSNAWQESLEGSYFNNFDNTTHVSEILRFMAGIISHSIDTSSPTANTKYWNTLSTSHTEGSTTSKGSLLDGVLGSTYENARLSQHWTSSAFIDMSETGSYRTVQDYLTLKGWVLTSDRGDFENDTGTNPFHGSYASRIPSTIQTQATLGTNSFTITANAGGSSAVYSNSNYFGMGGLTSGGATAFNVRVLASQSFSDNYADATPDENSTFTTASVFDYSITDFGTSNGLVLAKIDSANPAVIPAAYQDGDFNTVTGTISGRKYTGGATSATSISASGYYATHDIKAGLKSGSQSDYVFKNGSDSTTKFYLYAGSLPSDITNSQPTAVVTSNAQITAYAATSRSLSGAPYLLTNTYTVTFDSEVSKSFDPCYGYGTSVLVNSNTTDTWENIGSTTLSNTTCTVNNSGVSSTGVNTYVIDSTKTTKRGSSATPHLSDIAVVSSSLSFTLDSNTENVGQNRTANNTLNYSLVFRARGRNWKNTSVDSTSSTFYLWDESRFGQVAASGSMAVYSRAQGYDTNTLQDLTETFTGEDFRIVLADNVQSFGGAYFTTDSFQTNDEGDSTLGRNDLQVKPGYLVDPSGSYGYWFTSDSLTASNAGYRYYIRRFQTPGSTYSSMTLDVGKTLVNWTATTADSVAATILFESSGNGSGNNSSLGVARIYDPTKLTSNLIEADISQDHIKNPFSTAISLYGNSGGSKSSTEYTIPIRNADGMYLDSSDNELYVIIRYKGDPSPVTSITLSFS